MMQQLYKDHFPAQRVNDQTMRDRLIKMRARLYSILTMPFTDQKAHRLRRYIEGLRQSNGRKTLEPFAMDMFTDRQGQQQRKSSSGSSRYERRTIQNYKDLYHYIAGVMSKIDEIEPCLHYDEEMLRTINEKCLTAGHHIKIINSYSPEQRLQKVQTGSNFTYHDNYYIVLSIHREPVSQIRYDYFENDDLIQMDIISDTKDNHRNQRYNTLLRAATILLVPSMRWNGREVGVIASIAENPLSVYSLLKLGFVVDEDSELQIEQSFADRPHTKQQEQQLKTYLIKSFQEKQVTNVDMLLHKEGYGRSIQLAVDTINKICHDCLKQRKRKRTQLQASTTKGQSK